MAGEKLMYFPIVIFFIGAFASLMASGTQSIHWTIIESVISVNISFTDFVILLCAASGVVALLGIGIFGSGMGGESIKIVFKVAMMSILWFFFGGLSGIAAIPLIGSLVFWGLSLVMFLGVVVNVGG